MMKSKPMSLWKEKFATSPIKTKNVAIIFKALNNAEEKWQRLLVTLPLNSKLLDSFLASVLLILITAAWPARNLETPSKRYPKLDLNQLRNSSIAHSKNLLLCKLAEDILIKLLEMSIALLRDLCFEELKYY